MKFRGKTLQELIRYLLPNKEPVLETKHTERLPRIRIKTSVDLQKSFFSRLSKLGEDARNHYMNNIWPKYSIMRHEWGNPAAIKAAQEIISPLKLFITVSREIFTDINTLPFVHASDMSEITRVMTSMSAKEAKTTVLGTIKDMQTGVSLVNSVPMSKLHSIITLYVQKCQPLFEVIKLSLQADMCHRERIVSELSYLRNRWGIVPAHYEEAQRATSQLKPLLQKLSQDLLEVVEQLAKLGSPFAFEHDISHPEKITDLIHFELDQKVIISQSKGMKLLEVYLDEYSRLRSYVFGN